MNYDDTQKLQLAPRTKGGPTKGDDANSLKDSEPTWNKTDFSTAIFFRDVRTFTYDCEDNDDHTY